MSARRRAAEDIVGRLSAMLGALRDLSLDEEDMRDGILEDLEELRQSLAGPEQPLVPVHSVPAIDRKSAAAGEGGE